MTILMALSFSCVAKTDNELLAAKRVIYYKDGKITGKNLETIRENKLDSCIKELVSIESTQSGNILNITIKTTPSVRNLLSTASGNKKFGCQDVKKSLNKSQKQETINKKVNIETFETVK